MKKSVLLFALTIAAAFLLAPFAASAADAAELWTKNCAKCHGKEGKGDTKVGKKMNVKDYSDPAVQAKFTDDDLFKLTKEGAGEPKDGEKPMPAFADKLKDDEIKALVGHIRSFKKK
jgi:mono/diheme cytochrome c family protein